MKIVISPNIYQSSATPAMDIDGTVKAETDQGPELDKALSLLFELRGKEAISLRPIWGCLASQGLTMRRCVSKYLCPLPHCVFDAGRFVLKILWEKDEQMDRRCEAQVRSS